MDHLNDRGEARMVDVAGKPETERRAQAEAWVALPGAAYQALTGGRLAKGEAFAVARLAGIMAAKQTSGLIPLCHTLPLTTVTVDFETDDTSGRIRIITTVGTVARTGVEMEALTAASVAALTIYDMCKGIDKGIVIQSVRLLQKSGGIHGDYTADPAQ